MHTYTALDRDEERKGEEGGEEGKQRMRKERVLYCLYAGVAPTMITNQPWRKSKTILAFPGEEREGRK